MRIELTHDGTTAAQTGFEVQAAHQDRSASLIKISVNYCSYGKLLHDKEQLYGAA